MTRENLVQEVAEIIKDIPKCDGATDTVDLEAGAKEIVDTIFPETKPGRGEELIEELYEATRDLPPYDDHLAEQARDEALTALILYVVALEAKPTVYRSPETVEVGPPSDGAEFDGSDEEYTKRIRELAAFCKDSPTNTAHPFPGDVRPFKVHVERVPAMLKALPLRIEDIVGKVDKMKVNSGSVSVYVELVTGERVRLIGIGRQWLRLLTPGGEIREKVAPGEVVKVIT